MTRTAGEPNEEILDAQDPDLLFLFDARPLVTPDQAGVKYDRPPLSKALRNLEAWSKTPTVEIVKAHTLQKEEELKQRKEREKQMEETRNKLRAVEHPEKPSENPER